jgi:hypothetical protein
MILHGQNGSHFISDYTAHQMVVLDESSMDSQTLI